MSLAVGLMSGTSLDGIDAALIDSDGDAEVRPVAFDSHPYDPAFRARLRALLGGRAAAPELAGEIAAVELALTERHTAAVRGLLATAGAAPGEIAVVGFHGQTLLHAPEVRRTWQIGDGALLAQQLGIPVVNDFRSADVAAGGEGAPFAPLFHQALIASTLPDPSERPVAVLNLGGVGNVTWIGSASQPPIAFDTGPGNALIDDWCAKHAALTCDLDGALALAGRADAAALAVLMSHPYFARPAPKSLDRDAFDPAAVSGLSVSDGAATLTEFTAASVAAALPLLPSPPRRWLVTGGGRKNPAIMLALRARLGAAVESLEAVGWDGDALEAQAFAYLALRSRAGLPLSLPTTTGVALPTAGGQLHLPEI
ncbi:anhydro-N-acetylmuramic acid kinase [Algihabitans albus]|uniref:anhydro-N-acetylmuramic acid kinase n=1 Tax=Algihabitans albus TaxID=2164067 RepID=UPI000E5D1A6C|nr:anhydro-N-acetylmuramic acid kinase [Algihabitans albus]